MSNQFTNPFAQHLNASALPYSGGKLYFYESGTSTPLATYSNSGLSAANTNPILLDAAGRPSTQIFLQFRSYKVVLKDSSDNTIWTADPVWPPEYGSYARFQSYNGNPNGNVAGTAGASGVSADVIWDYANGLIYVCTTTGVAAAAVWTAINSPFTGQIAAEVSVTAAGTTDIFGAASGLILITGAGGPITSLGIGANRLRFVRFDNAPTLTHNATSLILPGGADIVAAAGDCMIVESDASSNARVLSYMRAAYGPEAHILDSAGYVLRTRQKFIASGTWTKPTGLRAVIVEAWGAGGGGGGAANASGGNACGGGGGGGGGYSRKLILAADLGATETVTIGAAGTAGTAGGSAAGAGGNTTFGAHCTANGGGAGVTDGTAGTDDRQAGGAGGGASSGDDNLTGGPGQPGLVFNGLGLGGAGGNAAAAGGGGALQTSNSNGNAGAAPGGGGGGAAGYSSSGGNGGVGGIGWVIVWEFY